MTTCQGRSSRGVWTRTSAPRRGCRQRRRRATLRGEPCPKRNVGRLVSKTSTLEPEVARKLITWLHEQELKPPHSQSYGFPVREVCNFITFSLHTSTNIDRAVVVNGLCIVTQWKWKMKRLTVHRSKIYRLVLISSSRLTRGCKRGIDDGKQKVNNSSVLSLCIVFMCV